MRKIILSYDYELFFGVSSGTVWKSIIEPTNMLMDVMEQNGFRGNFFVDYLMFRELEKLTDDRAIADLNSLKNQILDMVRRGHRVELHLHPHWIDAKYNGDGTWNFDDFTHYSLSSLAEETIVSMFKDGTEYLTNLIREVEPDYKIVAFRAGGWAVQPFDKLKRGFIEAGIKLDSSTSYGIYRYQKDSYYDFRHMPDKSMYNFDDDVCKEVEGGQFLEVPITSFHRNIMHVIIDRIFEKFFHFFTSYSDGTHTRNNSEQVKNGTMKLAKLKSNYKLMCTFSTQSFYTISKAIKYNRDKNFLCYIDHPKDFSLATEKNLNSLKGRFVSIAYVDLLSSIR